LTENLLSLFILNDNEKITKLLRRLLAIYSRSIKRIKLKYFLQYYNNIIFSDYLKYKKLNNMFKSKRIQYKNSSKNNKLRNFENNNNFRTINTPSQYSYIMNSSEPIILRPSDNKMAFLMTPCYIVESQDINNRNISEYNNKLPNNIINKCYLTSRHKIGNLKQDYRRNNNDYIFDAVYFNDISDNTDNKINKTYKKSNNFKKINFPIYKNKISNLNNEDKKIQKTGDRRRNIDNKRGFSTDRYKNFQKRNNDGFEEEYFYFNNKKYNLYLGEDNYVNYSKKKKFHKNKNKSCILNEINSGLINRGNEKRDNNKINREIFSHLYNNNYLNNLKKIDNDKIVKGKINNNIKYRNIIGLNTERRQNKNYRIFERKENQNPNNYINDSHEYILHNSISNNKKSPYNKIIKNCIFSGTNFSLNDEIQKNKNNNKVNGNKKINKKSSSNNHSNNSNSQSNNPNLNHTSTTFSIGQGFKENSKTSKNKKENKIKSNQNSQNESLKKNELYQDNQDKNTTISNRISLQSLSDSKIMELAGHYGYEDSSSENYQMNNIIHNKRKFFKKNKHIFD